MAHNWLYSFTWNISHAPVPSLGALMTNPSHHHWPAGSAWCIPNAYKCQIYSYIDHTLLGCFGVGHHDFKKFICFPFFVFSSKFPSKLAGSAFGDMHAYMLAVEITFATAAQNPQWPWCILILPIFVVELQTPKYSGERFGLTKKRLKSLLKLVISPFTPGYPFAI